MKKFMAKVLQTGFVNDRIKHIVVNTPPGFRYISGQMSAISINEPGYHQLSATCFILPAKNSGKLSFFIQLDNSRDYLVNRFSKVKTGDKLILLEAAGTIRYKGNGLFIAGGIGIVPFMAIFNELAEDNDLRGNTLLLANTAVNDILFKTELTEMLGENYVNVLEIGSDPSMLNGYIGSKLLKQFKQPDDGYYYVCGPERFTIIIIKLLLGLGIDRSKIIFDETSVTPPLSYLLLKQAIQFN